MKIEVDKELFTRLIECVEQLSIIHQQPVVVQEQWRTVIVETLETAKTAMLLHSTDSLLTAKKVDAQSTLDAAMSNATRGTTKDQFM